MNRYRADLHIHTLLSPCGDLEMSPVNIIKRAVERKLDIIGITDHNSTLHGPLIRKLGKEAGVYVLTGAEVTTKEEVHCLAFFENDEILGIFQHFLDENLPMVKNKPSLFGYQVVVNEHDEILREIKPLLMLGLRKSINEVEQKVHELNGIFIPAHVNKAKFSLLENLGFLPSELALDAVEIGNLTDKAKFLYQHPEFGKYQILKNSDAHLLNQIGEFISVFEMETPAFDEIAMALKGVNKRRVVEL